MTYNDALDPGKFAADVHYRMTDLMKERDVTAITRLIVVSYVLRDGDYTKPYDRLFELYFEPACREIIDLAADNEAEQPEYRELAPDAYGHVCHVAESRGLRVEIRMGYDALKAGTRVMVLVGPSSTVTVAREDYEELIDDALLLQCLEAAGIDNCEAYSIGYQEYAKAKRERDGDDE